MYIYIRNVNTFRQGDLSFLAFKNKEVLGKNVFKQKKQNP